MPSYQFLCYGYMQCRHACYNLLFFITDMVPYSTFVAVTVVLSIIILVLLIVVVILIIYSIILRLRSGL